MQASVTWRPPGGTLGEIVAEARQRADLLSAALPSLKSKAQEVIAAVEFTRSLQKYPGEVALIAEVKRRSPSKGWIGPEIEAGPQAAAYARGGAAAISVLTEPDHFGGSNLDLLEVLRAVTVPVLKKDFHVDPAQLIEAKALGASAALVIVRAVAADQLRRLVDTASTYALELLIEVHTDAELDLAIELGAGTIGVNNRDLETLKIDSSIGDRLLRRIPSHVVAVAESGVTSRSDVGRIAAAGANAVLVGSTISASADPERAVRDLAGVRTVRRG